MPQRTATIETLPMAFEVVKAMQADGLEWGEGYVGTHGMAHGLGNVLDTAERLRDAPEIAFMFVGAGAEREMLIAEAGRRGLNNVVFQSVQLKEKLVPVWSPCDIALAHLKDTPLFTGALPTKMFEAIDTGLPIVLATQEGEASRSPPRHRRGRLGPARRPGGIGLRHPLAARRPRESATPRGREPCCSTEPQPGGPGPRHVAGAGTGRSGGIA